MGERKSTTEPGDLPGGAGGGAGGGVIKSTGFFDFFKRLIR
jgi:hypothetical protein